MLVPVMQVFTVLVHMLELRVSMPVGVFAVRSDLVQMIVMAVAVTVTMIVLESAMNVRVAMALAEVQPSSEAEETRGKDERHSSRPIPV